MSDPDPLDAVLHLLDRQVVDRDGLMVCKVDDVELTIRSDGRWEVTGLLAGPPALVPRFGGRLGDAMAERWRRLGLQEQDRLVPWRIALALVDELGSGVTLLAPREGLLERQSDHPSGYGDIRRRLGEAIQLQARTSAGAELGQVLDVRMDRPSREPLQLVAKGLVVGRGRPGGHLGYDRADEQGPWPLARLVRWIHRHSGYVPMSDIGAVDWENQTIEITAPLQPLGHA
jgi:sporulation protein YlmC with PRC-barrel domain